MGHEIVELFLHVLSPDLQGYEIALDSQGLGRADGRGHVAAVVDQQRHPPLRRRGALARGQPPALGQDRDQTLEADREAGGGHLAAEQPADHPVVSPAAGDGRRVAGGGDLEDRARVVAHAAHERRIEAHPAARGDLGVRGGDDRGERFPGGLGRARQRRPQPFQRHLGRAQPRQQRLEAPDGVRVVPTLAQLGQHARGAQAVELVERDEEAGLRRLRKAAVARDELEQAPVVDPHGEARQPEPRQGVGGGEDQLDLDERRGQPQHVDVALGELPEAALLRPLRAPHGADLDRLQRVGQPRVVLRVVTRERHREVEAQAEVGQILPRAPRRLELLAALHDLEDQLLVLAAVAAGQQAQALERRRLDAAEAVRAVDGDDLAHGRVAQLDLVGEDVAHTPRGRGGNTAGHAAIREAARLSSERRSGEGCSPHPHGDESPVVMMICVSAAPLRKVVKRTTAAMRVGGFSPGMAPSAVMVPSKPELTDWKR